MKLALSPLKSSGFIDFLFLSINSLEWLVCLLLCANDVRVRVLVFSKKQLL